MWVGAGLKALAVRAEGRAQAAVGFPMAVATARSLPCAACAGPVGIISSGGSAMMNR